MVAILVVATILDSREETTEFSVGYVGLNICMLGLKEHIFNELVF